MRLEENVQKGGIKLKLWRLFSIALIAFVGIGALTAQDKDSGAGDAKGNWSSYYYTNVPLEKVYPHKLGYVVIYRKGGSEMGRAYLPLRWFTESAAKGDIINLPKGRTWPYMSVFYKDGAFSHVRLFIRQDFSHESWGNLPLNVNIDGQFEAEELKLDY
jgi:hypothetical protein